jgi:hypothetical protein
LRKSAAAFFVLSNSTLRTDHRPIQVAQQAAHVFAAQA